MQFKFVRIYLDNMHKSNIFRVVYIYTVVPNNQNAQTKFNFYTVSVFFDLIFIPSKDNSFCNTTNSSILYGPNYTDVIT